MELRREFKNGRNIYRRTRLIEDEEDARLAGKRYKREVNKQFAKYRKDFNHGIKSIKSTNPNEYWKIINSKGAVEKADPPSEALMGAFANHFERLGNNPNAEHEKGIPMPNIGFENV